MATGDLERELLDADEYQDAVILSTLKGRKLLGQGETAGTTSHSGSDGTAPSMVKGKPDQYCDKLPPVGLPKFSGKLEEWRSWSSLTKSLVLDRPNTSDHLKLTHILNSLVGEPYDAFVKGTTITRDDLKPTLEKLKERYGNETMLLQHHIGHLHEMKALDRDCHAKEMRKTLNEFESRVREIKAIFLELKQSDQMKGDKEPWQMFLAPLLLRKFPPEVTQQWDREKQGIEQHFDYMELVKFLGVEIGIVEKIEHSRSSHGKEQLRSGFGSAAV